jgi:phenylpropionate dioxygenase-like ring-hydroxylating dioxygenase large terminal subunit
LTPRWYSHIGQNRVLEDDQIFLHHQERYLEAQGGSSNFTKAFYLPTKADLFVFQLRSWVNQYSIDPFAGKTLSPALPKVALLDRYHSHTEKCASCRTALTNLKRIRMGLAVAIALSWSVIPILIFTQDYINVITVIISSLLVAIGGGVWFALGNLEQKFYQGQEIPPRNLPGK